MVSVPCTSFYAGLVYVHVWVITTDECPWGKQTMFAELGLKRMRTRNRRAAVERGESSYVHDVHVTLWGRAAQAHVTPLFAATAPAMHVGLTDSLPLRRLFPILTASLPLKVLHTRGKRCVQAAERVCAHVPSNTAALDVWSLLM